MATMTQIREKCTTISFEIHSSQGKILRFFYPDHGVATLKLKRINKKYSWVKYALLHN